MLNNKFLTRVVGPGAAQIIGGGPEYYTMASNIAFFRDDFTGTTLDAEEWISTVSGSGITSLASAGNVVSAGFLVIQSGTGSGGTVRLTSKRSYSIPFRVTFVAALDGFSTANELAFAVRDTSGVSATTVSGTPTHVAKWLHVGATAGGTIHSSAMMIRAGGTSGNTAGGGGYMPQVTAQTTISAATTLDGSASISYILDVDYSGITFATHASASVAITTGAWTTLPPPPLVLAHYPGPMLKTNQKYCVEVLLAVGSACVEAANASNTGSPQAWIDFIEVRQYSPAAALQRPGPLVTYSMIASTVVGNTAQLQLSNSLKWY